MSDARDRARDLLAEATMGMLDHLEEDPYLTDEAQPQAVFVIFAYSVPENDRTDEGEGMVRWYCTDASWWRQIGLLRGALHVHAEDMRADESD